MAMMKTKSAPRAPKDKSGSVVSEVETAHTHVGDVLRRAREEREITIDMVADELMIRRFYLDALEKGVFEDLPERVYATGFVKNYANYLGLDSKALIDQFKRDAYGSRQGTPYQVTLNMPEPVAQSVVPGRSAIMTAFAVLAVLIAGVIWLTQKDKAAVDTIPEPAPVQENIVADIPAPAAPVTTATTTAPDAAAQTLEDAQAAETGFVSADPAVAATTENTNAAAVVENGAQDVEATVTANGAANTVATNDAVTNTAEATNETAASPATTTDAAAATSSDTPATPALSVKNHRVLEAIQSSWVEVRDEKNTILFTSILKKGQILPLPDNARLTITTGNAGGLRMLVDGKAQPVFGQPNEVKRNMVIAPRPLDRH